MRADSTADEMLAEQDMGGKAHEVHFFNMNEINKISYAEPKREEPPMFNNF